MPGLAQQGSGPPPPAQGWDTGPLASCSHGSWKPLQYDGLGPTNWTILPLQIPRCQEPPRAKGPFRALEKLKDPEATMLLFQLRMAASGEQDSGESVKHEAADTTPALWAF